VSDFQARLQQALDPDFLIERELGGAGMSRVFLATERSLDRRVVVKVLPPELAAGVNIERFRREIQLAAQLQHPHIVPLLAAGDKDGILWFSMPFIEGESLRGSLTRQRRLPPRDVVRILHDVVDALAYAHARGIVHRDIKPENILTSGMHALVTDFGVAKALSASIPVHGGTTTGMAIGTPAYMAPEQLAADPAADHRVDLYAVGLLAYELLTGRGPFGGTSPQATLAAQLTQMPQPPHLSITDIPEPLSALIMHCLEKDASKRPSSASALLAELEALPPMSSGTTPAATPARRRTGLLVAGALTLAAALYAITTQWPASSADDRAAPRARDAGPGSSSKPMSVAPAPARDTVRDTIPVFREVGDGTPTTSVPFVITRAESLAIAEAVRKRQASTDKPKTTTEAASGAAGATSATSAAGAPATASGTRVFVRTTDGSTTSVTREMLLAEVGKIFADSMATAMLHMDSVLKRAPNFPRMVRFEGERPSAPQGITLMMAPPTDARVRIVVTSFTNTTGRREFSQTGRDVARYLREAVPANRFDLVPEEITERATRSMAERMSVGWGLRADYVIGGMIAARGDSVVVMTTLTDVKSGRFTRWFESAAPVSDAKRAFEPARVQVSAWLDTAATIAARRGQPRAPGGPDGRR
jgi:serine/threonine-protein kinase